MKKIINITFCIISIQLFAQIKIGETNNSTTNTSVLLNFENSNNRGILLPAISSTTSTYVDGTLILDATNNIQAQFKLRNNNTWDNFSRNNGNATLITNNRPTTNDFSTAKVVLGAANSTADGALVLESTTQTMVLPIVSTVDNIVNPSPGMMVYVDKGVCPPYNVNNPNCIDQYLAFYNGTEWNFWTYTVPGITFDPPHPN